MIGSETLKKRKEKKLFQKLWHSAQASIPNQTWCQEKASKLRPSESRDWGQVCDWQQEEPAQTPWGKQGHSITANGIKFSTV